MESRQGTRNPIYWAGAAQTGCPVLFKSDLQGGLLIPLVLGEWVERLAEGRSVKQHPHHKVDFNLKLACLFPRAV